MPATPRDSPAKRGYDHNWAEYSKDFRNQWPQCAHCKRQGKARPAREVDHIIPHKGQSDPMFWEPANHQGLCTRCHSIKTAAQTNGTYDTTQDVRDRTKQLNALAAKAGGESVF